MICMILAAGYATRMYPLTENFPKPLLPVADKPILDWLLGDIDRIEGLTEYCVLSNHRYIDHFRAWAEHSRYHHPIRVLDDGSTDNEHRLGAVRDLLLGLMQTGTEQDVLVIAGDNVLDFSLEGLVRFAREKDASCVASYREPDEAARRRSGVLELDETGKVKSMEEKPEHPKSDRVAPPFYYYHRRDLPVLMKSVENGCATDAPGSLFAFLASRAEVYAYPIPGKRYDVGSLEGYRRINELFAKRADA